MTRLELYSYQSNVKATSDIASRRVSVADPGFPVGGAEVLGAPNSDAGTPWIRQWILLISMMPFMSSNGQISKNTFIFAVVKYDE